MKRIFFAVMSFCALGSFVGMPQTAKAQTTQTQNVTITGQVVDDLGEGLPGATVSIKGSTTGTATDIDGNFRLSVPANATITISFVGYTDKEVQVAGRSALGTIQLAPESTSNRAGCRCGLWYSELKLT